MNFFYPNLFQFIRNIEAAYGTTSGTKIRITLPHEMFGYAWREMFDGNPILSINDNKPKSATLHIGGFDCIIDSLPGPERFADYFVPNLVGDWAVKKTFPIGQQPEGAVMVPGSERQGTNDPPPA